MVNVEAGRCKARWRQRRRSDAGCGATAASVGVWRLQGSMVSRPPADGRPGQTLARADSKANRTVSRGATAQRPVANDAKRELAQLDASKSNRTSARRAIAFLRPTFELTCGRQTAQPAGERQVERRVGRHVRGSVSETLIG